MIKGVGVDSNNPTAGTYLCTDEVGDSGAIISIRADGVRVTGIAFRGKQVPAGITPSGKESYNWASVGIHLQGVEDVRIDHCYFTSCRLAGISVRKSNPGTLIDHNWFVDNWINSLGYGICLDVFTTGVVGVKIFIEDNYFENNRHDVAAGFNGCYVARHNHSYNNEETSRAPSCHNFDAHGSQNSSDPGTYGAEIYNNYVEHAVQVGGACLMRGIVTDGIVYNNTFKTLAYGTYFSMYDGGPTGTDKYYVWNNTYIDVNQELRIAPNGWKIYRYAPAGYTPDPYPHPQNDDPCHPGPNGVFMCPDTVTGTISGPVMDTELLIADVVSDATYYVAADGDDSNPGTLAEPWRTIGKANQELQAGDTVYIRGGTYDEMIEPVNSGSAGKKITYKNYPNETVTIKQPAYTVIIERKNYIVIDGFYVDEPPMQDPRDADKYIYSKQFSSSPLKIRLTCLERWGYRSSSDYNLEWLKHVKDGGFNTVLVGGGSEDIGLDNW